MRQIILQHKTQINHFHHDDKQTIQPIVFALSLCLSLNSVMNVNKRRFRCGYVMLMETLKYAPQLM